MAVEIYWGDSPGVASEVRFLRQLEADLDDRRIPAVILANFFITRPSRQVDFFVITDAHVCHVELKGYSRPLVGQINGQWSSRRRDGSLEIIDRQNPYVQALECKYALSDAMHDLAKRENGVPSSSGRFYREFDSVVCIFPRLEDGSEVPDDFRVRTLGYAEFADFLSCPGPRPPWDHGHWMTFIRALGLTRATTGATTISADAQEIITSYSRHFGQFYKPRLHAHVPLPLTAERPAASSAVSAMGLVDLLQQVNHVQLVGPSGCGKSHLAKHTALAATDAGHLVVFVDAGLYEGRLSALLDRCVGRHSTYPTQELLGAAAATGNSVLVVIDGFNECPQTLQERLIGDLSAFCLRTSVRTLITSQITVPLPDRLSGLTLSAAELHDDDRLAVLTSYSTPDILQHCVPFSTAYELSIAAECATELAGITTRARLLDAFIRKRLGTTSSRAHVREALRHLAVVMDQRLATWLPADDVWRMLEQALRARPAPLDVIDQAFDSSIVIVRQGRFSFSHELLGRFLAAEAMLLDHADTAALVDALEKPRHQDLAPLIITLEKEPDRVGHLLEGLADAQLFGEAMLGHLGQAAARIARSVALDLLGRVTTGLASTVFTVANPYDVHIARGYQLSESDQALTAAIGTMVFYGQFLDETAALLDATDAASRQSESVRSETGRGPTRSEIVSAVLAGPSNGAGAVAARILLDAYQRADIDSRFGRRGEATKDVDRAIAQLVAKADSRSYGRLLLVCSMLDSARSAEAGAHLPKVLKLCWDSAAYHVRLAGLQAAERFARTLDGHPLHAQIVDILDTFDTTNLDLGVSTQLVETLNAYSAIDSPVQTDDAQSEIAEILQGEWTSDRCEHAYYVVANQFENIVGEAYGAVIDALDAEQRTTLYTMAAVGSPQHGFWNDWLLQTLADTCDRRTLPAFERWATHLNLDNGFIQSVGTCYMLAMQGSAQLVPTPPLLEHCRNNDEEAWQCYGAIVFWLHKPGLVTSDIATLCTPYWRRLSTDLAPAAADALYWLSQPGFVASAEHRPILRKLAQEFPGELRSILEWSLRNLESLTSIFGYRGPKSPAHGPGGAAQDIIAVLGLVGDENTVELLRPYIDYPDLGAAAIKSIRSLAGD
jgi:energy-coupling factor transporter ATP-binding protein EcfA2